MKRKVKGYHKTIREAIATYRLAEKALKGLEIKLYSREMGLNPKGKIVSHAKRHRLIEVKEPVKAHFMDRRLKEPISKVTI